MIDNHPAAFHRSDSIEISVSPAVREPSWDLFIQSIPNSHFEQTSGWGAVRGRYGWETLRVIAQQGKEIVGGVQVLTRRIGRIGTIGYISRGPTVRPDAVELEKRLVTEVELIARRRRWLYAVFDYHYGSHALSAEMFQRGYFAHPIGIPPSGLLDATILVDLRPDESVVLGRMNSSVRRNIRRAQRSDLRFALGGAEDIPKFRELMAATCARRQTSPTPPQKDYFTHLWTELNPGGGVQLFLVRSGDEIVSAAFAFTISNTLRVWKVGWSGRHGEKNPNHFMWWEIMRWGKSQGYETLDFVWIDTQDAKRAALGELTPEGFRDGTSYFKLGFGGKLFFTPPVQSKFFHPLARIAFKLGGAHVLTNRIFQRALAQYWARKSAQ